MSREELNMHSLTLIPDNTLTLVAKMVFVQVWLMGMISRIILQRWPLFLSGGAGALWTGSWPGFKHPRVSRQTSALFIKPKFLYVMFPPIAGQLVVLWHEGRFCQQRLHGHDHRLRQAGVPLPQVSVGGKVLETMISHIWFFNPLTFFGINSHQLCGKIFILGSSQIWGVCGDAASRVPGEAEQPGGREGDRRGDHGASPFLHLHRTGRVLVIKNHEVDHLTTWSNWFLGHRLQECLCSGALQGGRQVKPWQGATCRVVGWLISYHW